jgi:hypothetical protein
MGTQELSQACDAPQAFSELLSAEATMTATTLLAVGLALALPQDTDAAQRALDIVRKVEGAIEFDAKAPGKRVISLNL